MNTKTRKLLYTTVCIPLRFFVALCPLVVPDRLVQATSLFLGMIGLSFATLYFFSLRLKAPEGGGVTWWNYLRPIHAETYMGAAYSLYTGKKTMATILLLVDTLIGIVAWSLLHEEEIDMVRDE